MKLTDEQIDLIANDGHRNVAGGIYATSVYEFARAIEQEVLGAAPTPTVAPDAGVPSERVAQPDERAAFEAWFADYHEEACTLFGGIDCTNPKGIAEDAWNAARAAPQSTATATDDSECESCVAGKCVTGKRCVTLGRDAYQCGHCKDTGYLPDGNHCQWCALPARAAAPQAMSDERIRALRKASAVLCGTGHHDEAGIINTLLAEQAAAPMAEQGYCQARANNEDCNCASACARWVAARTKESQ